jgi:hypothetical protein
MRKTSIKLGAAVVIAAACSSAPQPGDPGYSYNLSGVYQAEFLADDGSAFRGTVEIETLAGGLVSGSMNLVDPLVIAGPLEGEIVGAQLTLEAHYSIPDTGCSGVASGSGVIEEGGVGVAGTVAIVDECGDAPTAASYTLSR